MVPKPQMTTLVVLGQGYVGLPMALHAARAGLRVFGLDTDEATVDALNRGVSHISDVSESELRAGLEGGYAATTDVTTITMADVVLICVPTPLAAGGGPDLGAVEAASRAVGEQIRSGTLAILESTTYPGTTEEVLVPAITNRGFVAGKDVFIAYSPERIDPGNKVYGVQNTPKVVGGITPACAERAAAFYSLFVDEVVTAKGAREAEMSKLLENTFRHVNIALVNEMLRFSEELDIDLWDAIDCAETKPFGFMAFRPGPGVGGHCIPVDPSYLSHRVKARLGYSFRMVELAEEINSAAPLYVASRIREVLNAERKAVNGSSVLLLGVTYKPDIADTRESPADPLARRLLAWGAEVSFHDPFVETWRPRGTHDDVQRTDDPVDASTRADITVLLQQHRAYDLEALAKRARLVLDTRAALTSSDTVVTL